MPVRIYALAKKLNLDSKVLVDICKKAGITGKGSALASLSDEEVDKVNSFMDKSQAKPKATAKAAPSEPKAIRREDYIAPGAGSGGKVPVMNVPVEKPKPATKKAEPPEEPQAPEAPETPALPETPTVTPTPELTETPQVVAEKKPVERKSPLRQKLEATKPPEARKPIEPKPQALQRPKIGAEQSKKPPVVTPKKPGDEKREPPKPTEKTGPTVILAPMPAATTPAPKAKKNEPAPQKPDIKLPPDAIRAASKGSEKPLSEHIRKHEKKKTVEKAKGPPRPGEAVEETPARGRERGRRRKGAAEEKGAPVLGGREARQLKRKRASNRNRRNDDERFTTPRRRVRMRRTGANTAAPRKGKVVLQVPCSVRDFSEAVGIGAGEIQKTLLGLGMMATINSSLDHEMAELLAVELGVEVDLQAEVGLEDQVLQQVEEEDDPSTLQPRPPVVTFLGHVDHGKTSLLDRIIDIDVVSGEKGGITQHIRAYRVEKEGRAVAFVDTPGHEAFTEMRARGANVTDIAVLVVAADDGVMPQTEEAISHAKAAEVPIVVALNKIDLPGVDEQKAYTDLAANELLPAEWGGDIDVIKTSAITGEGIDELLETLLTVAELHEYSANPDRGGVGTCLEAELHEGRGVVSKLLVQRGTMRVGDVIVCGSSYGRVKAMYDTLNPRKKHKEAPPSTPVNVTGLNIAPNAGDQFFVLDDLSRARTLAEERAAQVRSKGLVHERKHVTFENLLEHLDGEEVGTLNLILRADVKGSIEAIKKELTKLDHPEVEIHVRQALVGGITEGDVHLADATDAVIIGFNVVEDEGAKQLAKELGVEIRRYDIIYQVTEHLKQALEGMLKPEEQEKELGRALVKQTFKISRIGTIAGCQVLSGVVQRDSKVRVIRDSVIIGTYPLDSLKREKDDAREVRGGFECGMKLKGFNDLKEGDILEAFRIEEIRRTFEESAARAPAAT